MNLRATKKGFTIIEVVLVLAIAALIFLMIFVALPALQRGQANTARKNDANTVSAATTSYRTNNNGTLPTTHAQLSTYIDTLAEATLATGAIAVAAPAPAGSTVAANAANLGRITVFRTARCGTTNNAIPGTARQAVVLVVLETAAGQYTTVCQNA